MTVVRVVLWLAVLHVQFRIYLQGVQAAAEEAARPFVRRGH